MKQIFFILLLAGGFFSASAKHITGGEIIYDYLGRVPLSIPKVTASHKVIQVRIVSPVP